MVARWTMTLTAFTLPKFKSGLARSDADFVVAWGYEDRTNVLSWLVRFRKNQAKLAMA